jgi:predicted PurR-regulated permease PerM
MPDDNAAAGNDPQPSEQLQEQQKEQQERREEQERTRAQRLAELLRGPFDIKSFALTALFVFALFCIMYFMRPVLLPLVLALLLSYLLTPLVRALGRTLRLPPLIGAAVVLLCTVGFAAVLVIRLAAPAASWMEKLPYSFERIEEKLKPLKKPMQKVNEATAKIEEITAPTPAPGQPVKTAVIQDGRGRLPKLLLSQTPEFLMQAVEMVILLYFLLAYDGLFLSKLIKVSPRLQDKKRALTITREIERCISRYLLTVTCINAGLGTTVGVAVGLLGMPNPVLWGVMVMTFNFVPYLGSTVGIISMALAAVLSFDSLTWALVFPATYLGMAVLEGNFITPMILGHSLTLNPIVIIITLMFWGWMWGIVGAILAVPILATFKIFCDHVEPLAPIGEFLST